MTVAELIRELQALPPDLPVVMAAAGGDDDDDDRLVTHFVVMARFPGRYDPTSYSSDSGLPGEKPIQPVSVVRLL